MYCDRGREGRHLSYQHMYRYRNRKQQMPPADSQDGEGEPAGCGDCYRLLCSAFAERGGRDRGSGSHCGK